MTVKLSLSNNIYSPIKEVDIPAAFQTFVREHCPGHTLASALKLVREGQNIAFYINNATEAELSLDYPERRLSCLAPFHWYLMYLGIEQAGENFHEGMIVFKDPGHRYTRYFKGALGAYRRWSSHFCTRVPNSLNRCKFLGFNTNAVDLKLSARKETVIFSELQMLDHEGEWSMIKAEDDSTSLLSPKSFLLHTWKWITRSVLPRISPELFGNHNTKGFREELTPPETLKKFEKLMNEVIPNPSLLCPCRKPKATPEALAQKKKTMEEVNSFGIAAIYKALMDPKLIKDQPRAVLFQAELLKQFSHPHLATGKEIVLTNVI